MTLGGGIHVFSSFTYSLRKNPRIIRNLVYKPNTRIAEVLMTNRDMPMRSTGRFPKFN